LTGHVTGMEEIRKAYRILDGKLDGKRPLGRPNVTREDNIRMNLRPKFCIHSSSVPRVLIAPLISVLTWLP
jgi:hypothetical protein